MADIPNRIYNATVKDAVYFDRYAASLNKKVEALLQSAQDEIVAAVAKYDPTEPTMTEWKLKRLEKLKGEIGKILDGGFSVVDKEVKTALTGAGKVQAKNVVKSFNSAVGANVFNVTVTPAGVKAIIENTMIDGNKIGEWWEKQSSATKEKLSAQMAAGTQAIQVGLVQGESVGDLIRRVRGTKTTPGVMDVTKRQAAALVRTSVMQVANAVRQETYKENADVLRGIEWVSTLDNRTTPLCRGLDGKQFTLDLKPIGHSMQYPGGPPAHWNCRSTVVPITKTWAELSGPKSPLTKAQKKSLDTIPVGERAAMGGPIPANQTYNDWLLEQSEEMQKDILGPGRWQLWVDNKLDMSDLLSNNGRPLTLRELAEKFGFEESVLEGITGETVQVVNFENIWKDAESFRDWREGIKEFRVEAASTGQAAASLKFLNAAGRGLGDIKSLEKFSAAAKRKELPRLSRLSIVPEGLGQGKRASGLYEPSSRSIEISSSLIHKTVDELYIGVGNHNVGTDVASIARHEYGHHLWHEEIGEANRKKWESNIFSPRSSSWWEKGISKYAGANSHEGFAECFAAYTSPLYGAKAMNSVLPKEIEDFFKKIFGKNRYLARKAKEAEESLVAKLTREAAEKEAARVAAEAALAAEKAAAEAKLAALTAKHEAEIKVLTTPVPPAVNVAGKAVKDLPVGDRTMIGQMKLHLEKGKIPAEGTKLRTLWESLAAEERKRLLDMWASKGKKVPESLMGELLGGGAGKAAVVTPAARSLDYLKLLDESSKEREEMKQAVLASYRDVKVEISKSRGYCDQVSVKLWENLGKPEALSPYSVIYGEEEHVLLYSPKTGVIIDPTGNQFGNRVFNTKDKSTYKSFQKLSERDIQSIKKETEARVGGKVGLEINEEAKNYSYILTKEDIITAERKLAENLSPEEYKSLDRYAAYSKDAADAQVALRENRELTPDGQVWVQNMNNAFAKAESLSKDTTFYRAVESFDIFPATGDIFVDRGFVSTSFDKAGHNAVMKEMREFGYKKVEIQVPAGTKVITFSDMIGNYDSYYQHEAVLPKGLKYFVKSKTKDKVILEIVK